MSLLESWVQNPGTVVMAKTLLHSLWQGAAVVLALAAALCVLRSARARYAAACVAMVLLVAGPVLTFERLTPQSVNLVRTLTGDHASAEVRGPGLTSETPEPASPGSSDLLAWAVPFWILGVILFYVRGVTGWLAMRRLRRIGVCRAPEL